jgi:hypothetical protein
MSSPSNVDPAVGAVVTAIEGQKPKKKRTGHNKGLTKKDKPKLANRLPREKGGLIAAMGDGLTLFDRALVILGPRVVQTKMYYLLDGKPCNATRIMEIAGVVP